MVQFQYGIGLNSAPPVVILILETSDRPEPVNQTIDQVHSKIDQSAPARQRPRKVESGHAFPVEYTPIRPIIAKHFTERALLKDDRKQGMAPYKATVHSHGEKHAFSFC